VACIKVENLTLGEVVRILRESKEISQIDFGGMVGLSNSAISVRENGNQACTPKEFSEIRVIFGIENVPLFEDELKSYKERLRIWNNLIDNRELEEAKKWQDELSAINRLPFDDDHIYEAKTLYNLISARPLLGDNKVEEAEAILAQVKTGLDRATEEVLFRYHYIQGKFKAKNEDYEEAIQSFLKARDLWRENFDNGRWLNYNIHYCTRKLGWLAYSAMYLAEAREMHSSTRSILSDLEVDIFLAGNDISFGFFKRAKKVLAKSLLTAMEKEDKLQICNVYLSYAYLYCRLEDWSTTLSYANKALEYIEHGSEHHLYAMYQTARALVGQGNISACTKLLSESKVLAKNNGEYTTLFKAVECLLTIKSKKSQEYLAEVAIPYLSKSRPITALDYCQQVKKEYEAKYGNDKRLLHILRIETDIYQKMHKGGEI